MLKPSKHSHPDKTVLSVAALVLARLKGRRAEEFDSLRQVVTKKIPGAEFLFLPALSLLFLLGLVEYRPKTDALEYVGSNETV